MGIWQISTHIDMMHRYSRTSTYVRISNIVVALLTVGILLLVIKLMFKSIWKNIRPSTIFFRKYMIGFCSKFEMLFLKELSSVTIRKILRLSKYLYPPYLQYFLLTEEIQSIYFSKNLLNDMWKCPLIMNCI